MNHPFKGTDNLRDASRGERLQRVLADAGVASRRACEELIKAGHVSVNGRVVTDLPCWVDPATDRILVQGRPLRPAQDHVYVMLNKPTRTLCAASDEPGADRATVIDLVRHHSGARLFPVGRLDYDTTGLLLLTNDGDLAHRLTHPRFGGMRVYDAIVAGVVAPRTLEELNRRIGAKNRSPDAPPTVQIVGFDTGRTILRLTLVESKGGTVQELLARIGHHVKHLDRVAFGPLNLTGIARGQWRELDRREVIALKKGDPAPPTPPKTRRKSAGRRGAGPKRAGDSPRARRPDSSTRAGQSARPGQSPRSGQSTRSGPSPRSERATRSDRPASPGPRAGARPSRPAAGPTSRPTSRPPARPGPRSRPGTGPGGPPPSSGPRSSSRPNSRPGPARKSGPGSGPRSNRSRRRPE